ncbi:MAG: T9SS type A sorting domain-containing protein [Winogradskyella sp.]|uniref:T9SS-dependent M36 family metallopeptidase n=1 Tax=Winogradskyella sp. TaxID=1883156 RepID=UPI00183895B6|nr:T9SS type A sorting domain-containing protein [Winogradskyella sp.]
MKKIYLTLLLCLLFIGISHAQRENITSYIQNNLSTLKLTADDATNFRILSSTSLTNKEFTVYYLQQEFNGYPIAQKIATVLMHEDEVKSFKHNFVNDAASKISAQTPSLSPVMAANYAISNLGLSGDNSIQIVDYLTKKDINKAHLLSSNLEAPLKIAENTDLDYILSYEIVVKTKDHWWVTQVNANTGKIESKFDAVISCNFDTRVDDSKPMDHKTHSHRFSGNNKTESVANIEKFTAEFFKSESATAFMPPLTAVNATYNAYPLKVETPNHGARTSIANPWEVTPSAGGVVPSPFGWHDFEESTNTYVQTTKTLGNNVEAYEDVADNNAPGKWANASVDGTSGDLTFDFPIDLNLFPDAYQDAAIVNLFVWNNYMHDYAYAYGFDETSGNFQQEDYDRFDNVDGAVVNDWDGDEVNAEAQDGSGLNNANMSTLVDGFEPRMQMFLWGASPFGEFFEVIEPTDENSFLGAYYSTRFPFVPIPRETDAPVEAQLVLVQDDGLPYTAQEDGGTPGPSPNLSDGCTGTGTSPETQTLVNAADLAGNIAVVRRGTCTFVKKITLAQNSGAIGVVLVNNDSANPDDPVNGGGEEYVPLTIPAISLSFNAGEALIERIGDADGDGTLESAGEVLTGKLIDRGPESNLINRDGDLDQGIIAHEYAHGISNRLVGGRKVVGCLIGAGAAKEEQMGEGWSDFFGLITTHNMALNPNSTDPRGIGTYVQFQTTDGPGIRPAPYSTDFAINDYTYGDIADPALTVPHGVGFVWSTMLWDLYWAFVDEYGYDPDIYYGSGGNNMVMQLVMDGMKLIPCAEVGFVEGRDSIIAADAAINGGANECLIRQVFATRGVGALAVQGSADSRSDQIENFDLDGGTFLNNCSEVLSTNDFDRSTFVVYPNPSNSSIFISSAKNFGVVEANIYDLNGRALLTTDINLNGTPSIDISNLSNGVYILNIKTGDDEVSSHRIIKN